MSTSLIDFALRADELESRVSCRTVLPNESPTDVLITGNIELEMSPELDLLVRSVLR